MVIQTTEKKIFQFLLALIGILLVLLFTVKINVSNPRRKSHGDNSGSAPLCTEKHVNKEVSLF